MRRHMDMTRDLFLRMDYTRSRMPSKWMHSLPQPRILALSLTQPIPTDTFFLSRTMSGIFHPPKQNLDTVANRPILGRRHQIAASVDELSQGAARVNRRGVTRESVEQICRYGCYATDLFLHSISLLLRGRN